MERPNFDTCTLQEAADYAVAKIVQQGERCGYRDINNRFKCLYRQKEKRCVIGWMLDEENPVFMRQYAIYDVFLGDSEELPQIITEDNISFFVELQKFHDSEPNKRLDVLESMKSWIDITPPQYKAWVNMT